MVILDSSPMPSSRVNTGSRASVAVLRKSSSSGFRNEFSQPYQAIRSPSTTADTTAIPKPDTERVRLACRWLCSWPFSTSLAPAASTSCSGGRNTRVAGLARYLRAEFPQCQEQQHGERLPACPSGVRLRRHPAGSRRRALSVAGPDGPAALVE